MVRLDIQISIITINYNGVKDTCELMDTLPLDDTLIEVIVIDNASQQDEATIIEQRYPQVKVIRSHKNLGFAGGNNLGIEAAHGKYLFFINNDTILVWWNAWSLTLTLVWSALRYASHGDSVLSSLLATPHSHVSPCATTP